MSIQFEMISVFEWSKMLSDKTDILKSTAKFDLTFHYCCHSPSQFGNTECKKNVYKEKIGVLFLLALCKTDPLCTDVM